MAKFERKTLKKTITTAEEQEAALARLLSSNTEVPSINTNTPSVSTEPVPVAASAIKAEKVQKVAKIMVEQPKVETPKERYPKGTQRVNLDLPQDLYDAVQEQIRKNGQTMKGFFMVAAWEYIQNRK